MALFSQDQLEAIAGALGDTDAGLTGPEIQHLIASTKMTDPGPVRHGTQLAADVSPTLKEAHLYCNLTRSYINYLLAELAEQGGVCAA